MVDVVRIKSTNVGIADNGADSGYSLFKIARVRSEIDRVVVTVGDSVPLLLLEDTDDVVDELESIIVPVCLR